MNVTVENLAPCKKLIRVEVEAQKVDETFDTVTHDFQKQVNLPGFRPGKAPREMVLRKYDKDIQDEVKRKLIADAYKQAVDEQKLDVLGYPDIEEIQFARAQPLQFAATVETAPEFEIPEYKGISVQREIKSVTDEDVLKAIDVLREQQVKYETVVRPAQTGDMAVVSYTGVCEGKPITELAPTAKGLAEQKNFWIEVGSGNFIPSFSEQLLGVKAGEKRTVTVNFPPDFVTAELQNKQGTFAVETTEVKERILPEFNEAFAKGFGAESVEKLRMGIRADLEKELAHSLAAGVRNQLVRSLVNRVNFELPDSAVKQETRNVVYDIVQDNAKRGISRDKIEEHKEAIYSAATQGARERVKVSFLLQKIAEKEDIKVAQEEISQRIQVLATMYQIPVDKFLKDLQKKNGLIQIYDQIMNQKVLDFLEKHAVVQEVPAGTLSQNPEQKA